MENETTRLLDRLQNAVFFAEKHSSVEFVISLARRAEPYRDVPFRSGVLLALMGLAGILYAPMDFHPDWILLDVLAAFGLGYWLGRSAWAVRWLTSHKRRQQALQRAAEAAFTRRGVSLTRERTGVFLFVSRLERSAGLLWDVGVESKVPVPELKAWAKRFLSSKLWQDFPVPIETCLAELGEFFGRFHPARCTDNPNEIPDRPVEEVE